MLNGLMEAMTSAKVYDLEQMRFEGMPTHPNNFPPYKYYLHRRHEEAWHERRTPAAGLIFTTEHTGTHIDALCHQSEGMVMHGGVKVTNKNQTPRGFTHDAVETVQPIIRRGVLLDAARYMGLERIPEGFALGSADLQSIAKSQDVEVRAGDVLMVRTGYGSLWSDCERYELNGGVSGEASRWLASVGVFAVGADNTGWDVPSERDPELGSLPGHVILLVRSGIYIIEHLRLEELAADAVYEFVFVGLPMKLKGATASPFRPIALVSSE